MSIKVVSFTGNKAQQYLPQLAQLRITVFREFPYLYEGAMDYETQYLQTYTQAPDAVLVVAFDGEAVVGVSTALPMLHESDNVKQPFTQAGYPINRLFYYGESVLLPAYRGRGIGKAFLLIGKNMPYIGGQKWFVFVRLSAPLITHSNHPATSL